MAKRSLTRFIFSRNIFLTSQFEEIFLHTSIIAIPYFFCLFKTAPRMYTHLSCFTSPQKIIFTFCSVLAQFIIFPLAVINFSVQRSRDRARDGSRKIVLLHSERDLMTSQINTKFRTLNLHSSSNSSVTFKPFPISCKAKLSRGISVLLNWREETNEN